MFIVFEGIDNCGKSTMSKKFTDWVNTEDVISLPSGNITHWTKEPQFGTEMADLLNSSEYKENEFKRESLFLEDRIQHQKFLKGNKSVVCDRYIWSGVAYAKVFSPNCFEFAKEIYFNSNIILQPDLHIFIDTPVETCLKREPEVGLDRLQMLRRAYTATTPNHIPLITISIDSSIEKTFEYIKKQYIKYIKTIEGV